MPLPVEVKELVNSIETNIRECSEASHTFASIAHNVDYNPIVSELTMWKNNIKKNKDILVGHYHNDHAHGCCHSYDDSIPLKCRLPCQRSIILNPTSIFEPHNSMETAIVNLQYEYEYNEDSDLNELIFGKHFLFNPLDKNVPYELKRIQMKYMYLFQKSKMISWQQYLSTLDPETPWIERQII